MSEISEKTKSLKMLIQIGMLASVYAAITWAVAPISYAVIQFRVSEALKGMATKRKWFAYAFAVGNFISNLFSPFGFLEYTWMPLWNFIGAMGAYYLSQKIHPLIGSAFFAASITFAVSFMLSFVLGIPFLWILPFIAIPEFILIVGFTPVMRRIVDQLEDLGVFVD
ncbi:MAG: QueT transporter family protein [Candidatus Asgardarchaeum sp.]